MIHINLHHTQIKKIDGLFGTGSARVNLRGSILKMVNEGLSRKKISKIFGIPEQTVTNIKNRFRRSGLEAALHDKPRSGRPVEIDGSIESEVVALVCSNPPTGFGRWTLRLLHEKLKSDKGISISRESIRLILHEHNLKPWQVKTWCIPEINEVYTQRMEDVLDLYEQAYDESRPVVCIDEKPVPLRSHIRKSVPLKEGKPKKVDYEYKRNGQASVFVGVEPLTGSIITETRETRKGSDFAEFLSMVSGKYPYADKISLVMDNLSTHFQKSVTDRYGDEKGKELWNRFDIHYTPVHGSWLNQAEIAIGVIEKQCFSGQRFGDVNTLAGNVKAWTKARKKDGLKIKWKFTKEKARQKFKF